MQQQPTNMASRIIATHRTASYASLANLAMKRRASWECERFQQCRQRQAGEYMNEQIAFLDTFVAVWLVCAVGSWSWRRSRTDPP